MAFERKFAIKVFVPATAEPAGDMPEKWKDGLVTNATRINDRRIEKIPDDGAFHSKIATPSSLGFQPMIKDDFVTKSERNASELKAAQQHNLALSFNDYNDKLNQAFATIDGIPAKNFKTAVENSMDIWARAVMEGTLRFTGDKIRGRGIAPIATFWIVGDPLATAMLRGGDVLIDGAPYNIAPDGLRPSLKSALQARLIQAGRAIVQSDFDPTTFTRQNTITANLLTGMKDPAKADGFQATIEAGKNYCAFATSNGFFFLDIQVGLTVI